MKQQTKRCSNCRIDKELLHFYTHKSRGHQNICKKCSSELSRERYQKDKQKYKDSATKWKKNLRNFYKSLKTNEPCTDCGKTYYPCQMEYDHLGDKDYGIAVLVSQGMGRGLLLQELEKCELVCVLCHRVRTYKRKRGILAS